MSAFVLASVLLASQAAPASQAKVSVQVRGAAAPLVVEQIAKQTGLKLGADRNMWRDYLCLSVKDIDSQTLLDKVAEACQARWVMVEGVKTLLPDYNLRERAVSAAVTRRTAAYAKSIKNLVASLDPKPPKSPSGEGSDQPARPGGGEDDIETPFGPAGTGRRLLAAYITAIGPAFFARLEPESRVVFSSSPTRMQRGLPNVNSVPYLAKWVQEHNDMVKVMAQGASEDGEVDDSYMDEMQKIMEELGLQRDFAEKPKAIEAMPAKLLLVVTSQKMYAGMSMCSVELRAFDRTGKSVLQEQHSLSEIDYSAMGDAIEAETGIPVPEGGANPPEKKPEKATPLVLGDAGKLWAKVHRRNLNPLAKEATEKPTAEELARVGDFVANEPLAGAPTDFFFALADHDHVNVVAVLPDDIIQRGSFMLPGDRLTLEYVGRRIFGDPKASFQDSPMVMAKSDSWLTATPADQGRTRRDRVDRVAVSAAVKKIRASAWTNLDTMAEFVASVPEEAAGTVTDWTWPLVDMKSFGSVFGGSGMESDWMRLWGLLDPGTRLSLRRGGSVSFAAVPEAARKEIAKRVFGPRAFLAPFPKPKGSSDLQIMNSMMLGMAMGMENGGSLADEPTEALPNGLDMRGSLASQSYQEDYLMLSGAELGFMETAALGLEEYAFFDLLTHMPGVPQEAESLASAKLRSGRRTTMRLRAEVVPNRGFQGMLMDPEKPSDTEFTAANMPPDLKATMESKKDMIRKSPMMKLLSLGFSRMGQQGEAPPP